MEFKPLVSAEIGCESLFDCFEYSGETFTGGLQTSLISNSLLPPSTVFLSTAPHDDYSSMSTDSLEYLIQSDFGEDGLDDFTLDFLEWDSYHTPCNESNITEEDAVDTCSPTAAHEPVPGCAASSDAENFQYRSGLSWQVKVEGSASGEERPALAPGGGEKIVESKTPKCSSIGFDEISKCFYMTITDAAKELKVGLTFLKKRCRKLGISRWPHRKMKSLKSLIQNVQELRGSDETFRREIETLEEHKRRMERMPQLGLTERTKKLRQTCFKANYKKRRATQSPNS